MTPIPPSSETPIQMLARSLFGFALMAALPACLTWIALALTPAAADASLAGVRIAILAAFGAAALATLFACGWALRTAPENLHHAAERIAWLLPLRRSLLILFILAEINLLAGLALLNVAPAYIDPARFLLACWSLLLAFTALTLHWPTVQRWLHHTQDAWMITGLVVMALAAAGALYAVNAQIVRLSGIDERLRGGLDYRELVFIQDGAAPTSQAFWAEQSRTRIRWLPYAYWSVAPFEGAYIRVDAAGLRDTPQYTDAPNAPRLYLFGGSTVWGEGARDAYTIPGHLARLLSDADQAHIVRNYGQTGYVSTQDAILFQLQLVQGNIPEVAIFYQGFNDILSAYDQQFAGVTLQEAMRLNDSEAGRLLRAGQPVLRLPAAPLDATSLSLAAAQPTTPSAVAERWWANVQLIRALAQAYDVQVLFVWQPAILYKETRTDLERGIVERMERDQPGLAALYAEVDALVRAQAAQSSDVHILLLSDLFRSEARYLFHDLVHITEEGNLLVAQAIMESLYRP